LAAGLAVSVFAVSVFVASGFVASVCAVVVAGVVCGVAAGVCAGAVVADAGAVVAGVLGVALGCCAIADVTATQLEIVSRIRVRAARIRMERLQASRSPAIALCSQGTARLTIVDAF